MTANRPCGILFDMKKPLIALVAAIMILSSLLAGCDKKAEVNYSEYFNNFSSHKGFEAVSEKLVLDKDIFVDSYHSRSGLYLIKEAIKLGSQTYYNYGFATPDGVILAPRYAQILDINGDFAIAVKRQALGSSFTNKVGLVRVKGENAGKEMGFAHEYSSTTAPLYTFLDSKYLIMFGEKDRGGVYDYATVYDYTTANGMLEVGRVSNTTFSTTFSLRDGYLAAVGKSVVRYYYFDRIDSNGYYSLAPEGVWAPFTEADGFPDMSLVTVSVFYLGNGWYVETGMYTSATQFTGYEQTKTSENKTYYYINKSTRYNIKSGIRFPTDRVTLVANKYSSEYVKEMTAALNTANVYPDDKLPMYQPPIIPPSEFIKEGYSLVYYDFPFYDDSDKIRWGQSFSVYDKNADIINLEDLVMPLLFVDGVGLQNSDPVYELPGRDLSYHKEDGSLITLMPVAEKYFYHPVMINDGMIVGYRADFNQGPGMLTTMMGAMSLDGSEIPYEFVELTMFVDGYATGSKIVVGADNKRTREFYRISKNGVITPIANVYSLKNGMYITKEGEKYGLYANDGRKLLDAEYESLAVIEHYLVDGLYFDAKVVGSKDGKGIIFEVTTKN